MAYSYTAFTGNGSTTQYAVAFSYIRREHVAVTVAGIPSTFTWVNNSLIQMDAAPANGAAVRVYRTTPISAPLVDFADGATLVAADLDTNSRQSIYIQQELDDAQTDNLPNLIPNGNKGEITTSVGGTVWAINNGAVTEVKLAANAVTSGKIADGTIVNADVNASAGITAGKLSFTQAGTGAVARTVDSRLKDVISVKDFGAIGDGTTNDTAAIQAAVIACPIGGIVFFPNGKYNITAEILLAKPITIKGNGIGNVYGAYSGSSDTYFASVQQATTGKPAFKLVASLGNYAFSQYGILGINFQDIQITGPSDASRAVAAINADTTINSGDYHIRHCHFDNVAIRYFVSGIDLTGIAYLNVFTNCLIYNCNTGVKIAKGSALNNGGQIRFFGCSIIACNVCAQLNIDGSAGSFAFFGCSLSESQRGIYVHEECELTVVGCEFESLINAGNGAGIYIEITEANPNSEAAKTITGNKFLTNDADIWINKTTTTFAGGAFAWPMVIDGNSLKSTVALKITVPAGHSGIASDQFVLGAANSGTGGPVQASQISTNFLGYDARKWALKAAPAGTVVGTTDTQTLSGKTFSQSALKQVGVGFTDTTLTISTASGTTGNITKLQLSDSDGSNNLAAIKAYGSGFGAGVSNWLALETQGVNRAYFHSTAFQPATDGTYALGDASARWSTVYASTGTINTSDGREKQDIAILSPAERRVAIALKGLIKKFRFKDAIQVKGDQARIHVGVIVQDVIAAFELEGLDPMRYGIVCYDQWSTGDRYGIRYDELFAFIISTL